MNRDLQILVNDNNGWAAYLLGLQFVFFNIGQLATEQYEPFDNGFFGRIMPPGLSFDRLRT